MTSNTEIYQETDDDGNVTVVIIDNDELDPNGEPVIVEMPLDEYNAMIGE